MNIRVAIVDDDDSVVRSLSRLLGLAGMEPSGYASAEDFLRDAQPAAFDCIVLDVQLGGISGLQLQARLVDDGLRVPIIFITAYDDPMARRDAQLKGCAAFFRKTDPGIEIISAIHRAVRHGASEHGSLNSGRLPGD